MNGDNISDPVIRDELNRLRTMAAANPCSPAAQSNLGVAAAQLSLLEEAAEALEKAIALTPDVSGDHINLGVVYSLQGRFEAAGGCFESALALDPARSEAYGNLGHVRQELGDLDGALEFCTRALELDAGNAEAAFNLHALVYDENNLVPAEMALKLAYDSAPEDERVRFFLAVVCEQMGKADEAAGYFDSLPRDSRGYHAGIDAWDYIKKKRSPATRLTGPTAQALRYALEQTTIDGLVLEFGVRYGTTLNLIAAQTDGTVHGFDSFEGLPEAWHGEPAGSYTTAGYKPTVAANTVLHKGWFEDTLPAFVAEHAGPVRFLHIDCDLYSSAATVFRHMGPRVRAGSIIVLDDYFISAGWREDEFKAFQEAVAAYGWRYEYLAFSLYAKHAAVRIIAVGA